jgi:hypothetical protein
MLPSPRPPKFRRCPYVMNVPGGVQTRNEKWTLFPESIFKFIRDK